MHVSNPEVMAYCNCFKAAPEESPADWAKRVVKEAVEGYKVTMFVDSNNSTCGLLQELFVKEIGVYVYVVEIDKMDYWALEKELERLTEEELLVQFQYVVNFMVIITVYIKL